MREERERRERRCPGEFSEWPLCSFISMAALDGLSSLITPSLPERLLIALAVSGDASHRANPCPLIATN